MALIFPVRKPKLNGYEKLVQRYFFYTFFSIPNFIALVSNIFKLTWIESIKSNF